jgi:hypothetical protein
VQEEDLYCDILVQYVTIPTLSWKRAQKLLREDDRLLICENLTVDKKEMLFDRHIENIVANKQRENFWDLVENIPNLEVNCEWKKVKKQLKNVPGFVKHEKNHEWVSLKLLNLLQIIISFLSLFENSLMS